MCAADIKIIVKFRNLALESLRKHALRIHVRRHSDFIEKNNEIYKLGYKVS